MGRCPGHCPSGPGPSTHTRSELLAEKAPGWSPSAGTLRSQRHGAGFMGPRDRQGQREGASTWAAPVATEREARALGCHPLGAPVRKTSLSSPGVALHDHTEAPWVPRAEVHGGRPRGLRVSREVCHLGTADVAGVPRTPGTSRTLSHSPDTRSIFRLIVTTRNGSSHCQTSPGSPTGTSAIQDGPQVTPTHPPRVTAG